MGFNLVTANLKLGLVEFNATFFFQIFNTFVLFLILKKLLFEPVTEFMENREKEIAAEIKNAEGKNLEAEKLKEKYSSKEEISDLTIRAASKVVSKNLKKEDHLALIDQFIDEVGDVKWQN
jgi:F-type H+-transporting ATPase subunit b